MLTRRGIFLAGGSAALVAASTRAAPRQGVGDHLTMRRTRLQPAYFASGMRAPPLADIGFLDVAADHFGEGRRAVFRLRFARFVAKTPSTRPPLVYLYGGPAISKDLWGYLDGGARYRNYQADVAELVDVATEFGDFLLIDHRGGLGCAFPRLAPVPLTETMPLDRPLQLSEREAHYGRLFGKLIDFWSGAGVELELIRTGQLASDLDALRAALGYDQLRLFGESNGTYRGREYLRQHAERVHDALFFVSHGYQKLPAAAHVRAGLQRVAASVRNDPVAGPRVPSLTDLLDELTDTLNRAPQTITDVRDGKSTKVVVDGNDLAVFFWANFEGAGAIRQAVATLWNMHETKNYAALASVAVDARMLGVRNGADAYVAAYAGSSMPSLEEIERNRRDAGASLYLNRQSEGGESSCAWPLGRDVHQPFRHNVPITYVQGEWDVRTPIEGPAAIGEPTARLVVNPASGHDVYDFDDERGRSDPGRMWRSEALRAFLAGERFAPFSGAPRGFSSPLFDA